MIIYTVYIMNFILFALFVFASFIYNKYLGIVSLIIFILYFYNKKEYMTNSYKYTAVIVEPRQHAALEYVLNNYNEHLSNLHVICVMKKLCKMCKMCYNLLSGRHKFLMCRSSFCYTKLCVV